MREDPDLVLLDQTMEKSQEATAFERLPVELLTRIFGLYKADTWHPVVGDDPFQRYNNFSYPWSWLAICHVCRQWRDIILQSPLFWTVLFPTRPETIRHAITHSAQLPLTLRLSLGGDRVSYKSEGRYIDMHQAMFAQLPRVRFAELYLTRAANEVLVSPEFAALEAPLLEELQLEFSNYPIPIFSSLLLPRLADLTVHVHPGLKSSTHDLLQALIRPTLTSLMLSSHRLLPLDSLFDLLRGLPSLARLLLSDVGLEPTLLDDQAAPLSLHAQPVTLPHLTFLWLEDSREGTACADLLEHLTFPSTTAVHFKFRSRQDLRYPNFLATSITRKLVAAQRAAPAFRAKFVCVAHERYRMLQITLWATADPALKYHKDLRQVDAPFSLWVRDSGDAYYDMAMTVLQAVDMSEVKAATIYDLALGFSAKELFKGAARLTTLRFTEASIQELLGINIPTVLPALKNLTLTRAWFNGTPEEVCDLREMLLEHEARNGEWESVTIWTPLKLWNKDVPLLAPFDHCLES